MHHNINLKINVVIASEFESVYRDENTTWNQAFEKAVAVKEALNEIESILADGYAYADTLAAKIETVLEKIR